MGQITNPIVKGIAVLPTDRESGPGAGAGATGNNSIFLGLNAGKNSTIAQFIAIGNNTANAGVAGAALNGSTVLGAQSLQALTGPTGAAPAIGSCLVVIGSGTLNAQTKADSSVIIGQSILPANANAGMTEAVLIGCGIGAQGAANIAYPGSVIIGYRVLAAGVNFSLGLNVIIGSSALAANTGAPASNVMIGAAVAPTTGSTGLSASNNVLIGANADIPSSTSQHVVIGSAAVTKSNGGAGFGDVVIGANTIAGSASGSTGLNVVIGIGARTPQTTAVIGGNVIIGAYAGFSLPGTSSQNLVIETNVAGGGTQKSLIFGNFLSGNVLLGNSVDGTNRDIPGTNTLKLLNGAIGANPVGGGYFYVVGGLLHWVDSAGNDSQLSESAGQLAANAIAAYTNNAGAQIATITNGPLAGNPTKWIPINDNGTIRNIPAW